MMSEVITFKQWAVIIGGASPAMILPLLRQPPLPPVEQEASSGTLTDADFLQRWKHFAGNVSSTVVSEKGTDT